MKLPILILWLLVNTVAAQGPPPPPRPGQPGTTPAPALPENYVLTLSIQKEGQAASELSLLVATTDFSSSFPDAKPAVNSLYGTISLEENGSVVVRYNLNVEIPVRPNDPNPQTRSSVTQSSVRLQLGEPVEILRAGTRSYQLSIRKAVDPPTDAR